LTPRSTLRPSSSSAALAPLAVAASRSASASISDSCRPDTDWLKNCPASSGIWCASSSTKACAPGRISPKPSRLIARSANSRWWLTTTTSASCAARRARTTKQSSKNGHSAPRQFSAVEVTRGHRPASSGTPSTSPMSPLAVRAAQARTRESSATSARLGRVPSFTVWSMRYQHR